MATRIRRRRRKPHHSRWHKIVIPLIVIGGIVAVAGGIGASWALNVYNSAPPLSSLQPVQKGRSSAIYAADGSLIGFIRSDNIRQPVSDRRCRKPQGRDGRDRGQELLQPRRDRPRRHRPRRLEGRPRGRQAGPGRLDDHPAAGPQPLHREPRTHDEAKAHRSPPRRRLFEKHDRDWILTQYLNTAPYGTVEGQTAVGAEAAAQTYFGKPAKDLDLTEAALIAGLPQAPSEYNPFLDPAAAKERRNEVLGTMEQQGYITTAEYSEATDKGLGLHPGDKYQVIHDPFLFDLVQQELIDRYGINTVRNGGLKAYTTIDPTCRRRPKKRSNSCYVCYPEGGPAAGLASVNPETGEIVALASTEGYASEEQFNYAWQAHRQPGSSFKTFVLTTAIKQGIDPATTYYDGTSPKTLALPGGGTWTVNNAEPGGGVMSLTNATRLGQRRLRPARPRRRPRNVTETAHEMGIESPLESVPAEAIGGLAERRHAAGNGRRLRDPRQRRHPPRPDRDQPGRIPQRQGRRSRQRLRRTGPDRGPGLRSDEDPGGGDHLGPAPATPTWAAPGRPARPAPPRKSPTPGSSATRRCTRPRSGSAIRSRAKHRLRRPDRGPIWQIFMSSAQAGECPEFEVPTASPNSPA